MYPVPDRVLTRIESRIEIAENGCWHWTGALAGGYGHIAFKGDDGRKHWAATHRAMYVARFGVVPDGLDIDHRCHDPVVCRPDRASECPHRRCCNPDHLSVATRRENLLRGGTLAADHAGVTHCPKGHPYDVENTTIDRLGRRNCKSCVYARNRAYYWNNREKRRAYNKAWYAKKQAAANL